MTINLPLGNRVNPRQIGDGVAVNPLYQNSFFFRLIKYTAADTLSFIHICFIITKLTLSQKQCHASHKNTWASHVVHYERNFTVFKTKLFWLFLSLVTKRERPHIWTALHSSDVIVKISISWATGCDLPPKKKSTLWLGFCLLLQILDFFQNDKETFE